jgi:hypothetical protein
LQDRLVSENRAADKDIKAEEKKNGFR